ncbi:MAG TPA: cobalamin B12-binding domain-containing protein [Nitrososphaerales archaeon]|nr:cobalamin B12-binding domain-containing protein [Nitrososphaerales archaeon]
MTTAQATSLEGRKIRILVAKPGLDGHDRGALVLCRAFRDAGMEVIYSGLLPTPEQVAAMAVDEDVDVVALSLLNGAHMTAFPKVVEFLKKKGGSGIIVVGGGIIPDSDKPRLERAGIRGNFGPGTSLGTIIDFVNQSVQEKSGQQHDGRSSKSKKIRISPTRKPVVSRKKRGKRGQG